MNISNKNITNLLDETLLEFKKRPVDMLNINDGDGEYIYLKTMRASYIRTIKDIVNFFSSYNKSDTKILEIGSFFFFQSCLLLKEVVF